MDSTSLPSFNTDLIIVGAGAAGLMGGVTAGENALHGIIMERRHRPGLKLLICGNNRCNISHDASAQDMIRAYGEPIASFIRPAIEALPPQALRSMLSRWNLQTIVAKDRIYPATEKADDVLHCFTDRLRDLDVPLMTNCPVESIRPLPSGGFAVHSRNMTLTTRFLLLAIGGFSFPKTGSVGDGQRFADDLGLAFIPPLPGLAGVDVTSGWMPSGEKADLPQATVTVHDANGRCVAVTQGNVLVDGDCLRGTAVFDAVRQIAHLRLPSFRMVLDPFPHLSASTLQSRLSKGITAASLAKLGIPDVLCRPLLALSPHGTPSALKALTLPVSGIRPLKEAVVTAGGIALNEIDADTMECKKIPGLFVAGELLDVDGPTGGFNLHAAFATARLAIQTIASRIHPPAAEDRRSAAAKSPSARQDGRLSAHHNGRSSDRQSPDRQSPKRSARGDRWNAAEPPPWRRRPSR